MPVSVCSVMSSEKNLSGQPRSQDFNLKETVAHGQAAFPAAIYQDDLTDMEVSWHWHEELEMGWITKGEIIVCAGSVQKVLQEGEGFFINSGLLHAMRNAMGNSPAELCSVVFHTSIVSGTAGSVFDQDYVQPVLQNVGLRYAFWSREDTELLKHLQKAWTLIRDKEKNYPIYARGELSLILAELAEQTGKAYRAVDRKQCDRVQQMLDVIHSRYEEPLSLDEIASEASVSVSEALRCFHRIIGMTPGRYLKKYRLARAAQLLWETDLPVAEIGSRCGFQDGSYFSRSFREAYGKTPAECRQL